MTPILMNLTLAFSLALIGTLTFHSHLMSTLLCLEGMMLSLFIMAASLTLNSHFLLALMLPIIILVFAACEAAVGLALLVMISNTHGSDFVQNLNLLKC